MALKEVLTEKETCHILKQALGKDVTFNLKRSEVRPAFDGLAGFIGDHMKATLYVDVEGEEKKVNLFIKRVPTNNKPKAEFINENNFYRREKLMYKVLEEINESDRQPWCVKAYLYTDSMIVMPDLIIQGYSTPNFLDVLDADHVFLTTTSIARFHASFVNYETKKSNEIKRPYSTFQEYNDILTDFASFCDGPFIRTCSKLSSDLLKTFSIKSYRNMPDLELKLTQLYIDACNSLTASEDTVNVLLHRDLWVNNIMFQYENKVPTKAVLVDYQCLRYGPPAFDLMIFLYLTTDRRFRQELENNVLNHYYSAFVDNLSDDSVKKMKGLGYDKDNFYEWCAKARMFGMLVAIVSFPYILMDPKTAQKTFDDPETFEQNFNEDLSAPVIAHASTCEDYKNRMLAVTEELFETYGLN